MCAELVRVAGADGMRKQSGRLFLLTIYLCKQKLFLKSSPECQVWVRNCVFRRFISNMPYGHTTFNRPTTGLIWLFPVVTVECWGTSLKKWWFVRDMNKSHPQSLLLKSDQAGLSILILILGGQKPSRLNHQVGPLLVNNDLFFPKWWLWFTWKKISSNFTVHNMTYGLHPHWNNRFMWLFLKMSLCL